MGILQTLKLAGSIPDPNNSTAKITAQYNPPVMDTGFNSFNFVNSAYVTRGEALQVPSIARARNLICGTIAVLPLHLYRKSTGQELQSPLWLEQFDPRQPRSVTLAYLIDSLLMYGVGYLEVTETYVLDGRPARMAFVSNDRVTVKLNYNSTIVQSYAVDGIIRPESGLNSLITFQHLDDGILNRGGRTIRAALDLERAASIAASSPIPSGYLVNSGSDLPEEQITGLLAAWKSARLQRATAFLSANLRYETTSFSPKDMQYEGASQFLATQCARLTNVPAYMLSADMNASLTYSNLQDERKQFVDMTLRPFISAIEDRLSMDDVTNTQNYIRFNLDETYLRSDAMTRLNVLEKMLALNLITLDQAKAMEDLTPNGDTSNAN